MRQLWAVQNVSLRGSEQPIMLGHFVAIYGREGGAWQLLARLNLDETEAGPDYLWSGAVRQAEVDPASLWLEVDGGVGAHGGTYHLLRFDGPALRAEVAASGTSPGVGWLSDLNGDGRPEVILDRSDAYVFCYACGVRQTFYEALRFDAGAGRMVLVNLQPLPAQGQADPALAAANRAVALAEAGLWKDAQAESERALRLVAPAPATPDASVVNWNHALIELHARAMAQRVADGPYPLLLNVFYGDYAAAVEEMRGLAPAEIFSPATPLFVGTVAEGYTEQLAGYIIVAADEALRLQPELADAYFLRGWARYLVEPAGQGVQSDVARAAALAPADALYAASAAHLR